MNYGVNRLRSVVYSDQLIQPPSPHLLYAIHYSILLQWSILDPSTTISGLTTLCSNKVKFQINSTNKQKKLLAHIISL